MSNGGFDAHDGETALLTSRTEHVRVPDRTDDEPVLTEFEYRTAVAEFDLLWSSNTSPEDQMTMKRLIRLIDAFESAHAIQPAEAAGRRIVSRAAALAEPFLISQTNGVNRKEMKR